MLSLSAVAKAEKNKLHTDSAFLLLMKIIPPAKYNLDDINVCYNTEDVMFQGELYQAFPFKIAEVSEDSTGSEPSFDLQVGNASLSMQSIVEQSKGGNGSDVLVKVINNKAVLAQNQHSAGLADPTFSRASTAYADDGSVVAANTPRMSSKGLLIEQEFNNLALNGDFRDGTTNWGCVNNSTINSFNLHGGQSIKFVAENKNPFVQQSIATTANNKFYVSAYCYIDEWTSSLDIPFLDIRNSSKIITTFYPDITKTKQWQIVSGIFTNDLSATNLYIGTANALRTGTFYATDVRFIDLTTMFAAGKEPTAAVCDLLFNKPIYGDKAADLFEIPAEVIPNGPWTIEFDAQTNSFAARNSVLFDTRGNTKGIRICSYITSAGYLYLQYDTGTTTNTHVVKSNIYLINDNLKHHYKYSYDGSNIRIYLDGNLIVTFTDIQLFYWTNSVTNYFVIGKSIDNYYVNGYISNLRISNVCRPDTDTTPAVDAHTTYYMPLTDNMNFDVEAEFDEHYTVSHATCNENYVTFTLGAGYNLRSRRPPYRYMKNNCPFKYKGLRCGCTSSAATCGHTLVDCRSRGNSKWFGGFPGIDQKGVYLND